MDRLRSLGNALVPQIAEWLGHRILAYEEGLGLDAGLQPVGAPTWGTPTARDHKDVGDMTNVPENGLLGRQVLNRR